MRRGDKLIQAVGRKPAASIDQSMRQWGDRRALAGTPGVCSSDVRAKLDQTQTEQAVNEATAGTQSATELPPGPIPQLT